MDVLKIAAFSDGETGGNPAGVVISEKLSAPAEMQAVAADVGFSETAFAAPDGAGWTVRYFSPETEVPFCGHATIALGAALALREGDGTFPLQLSEAEITVEGYRQGFLITGALQSPPTGSCPAEVSLLEEALDLFGYSRGDLDPRIEPSFIQAGAPHLLLALKDRSALSAMHYDLDRGREFMKRIDVVTVSLVVSETDRRFHARNPFASGGVYEDPATGAAAAALAGHLRLIGWPHGGAIEIVQGQDMGMRSLLKADIGAAPGSSIRVSGTARMM
ncbi:MAG TPA: PhzF family phenazine biosynthesis protein [Afifellaceae bacterium]|nr:PhzF family phenazine biosynthesis protein [Afifellaceae bacterium]